LTFKITDSNAQFPEAGTGNKLMPCHPALAITRFTIVVWSLLRMVSLEEDEGPAVEDPTGGGDLGGDLTWDLFLLLLGILQKIVSGSHKEEYLKHGNLKSIEETVEIFRHHWCRTNKTQLK
jgi:hypothetical protein